MDRRAFLIAAPPLLAAGCVSVGGAAGPPAPAPAFRVGDRWVYRCSDGFRLPVVWTETHEVTAVDQTGIAVRVTGTGDVAFSRVELLQSPGVLLVGAVFDPAETRRFAQPLTRYRFPLTPGDRWTDIVDNFDERTRRQDVVNRFVQVGGHESVTTTAGTFEAIAMRIIMTVNVNDPFNWPTQCNYMVWWADAVGAKVRETRYATYRQRGDGPNSIAIRAQNTQIDLVEHARGAK